MATLSMYLCTVMLYNFTFYHTILSSNFYNPGYFLILELLRVSKQFARVPRIKLALDSVAMFTLSPFGCYSTLFQFAHVLKYSMLPDLVLQYI